MGFLAKLFNAVPSEERKGLHLDWKTAHWMVSKADSFPAFLRALADLAPAESILYIEGGGEPSSRLDDFLYARSVPEQAHLAMGTIWPRPTVYHLPATRENLFDFAEIAEACGTITPAIHLHLYQGGRVLLQWYDAFFLPFFIAKEIPEEEVRKFCETLSLKYEVEEGIK